MKRAAPIPQKPTARPFVARLPASLRAGLALTAALALFPLLLAVMVVQAIIHELVAGSPATLPMHGENYVRGAVDLPSERHPGRDEVTSTDSFSSDRAVMA